MTTFWDQGLHARLLREAAHRNGLTTKVRLGFTIDVFLHDDHALLSVTFDELQRHILRATEYRDGYTRPVCEPPWGQAAITTPRDRLDNLIAYIDEGMPADYQFQIALHQSNESRGVVRPTSTLGMPGTPAGLAPVTDITLRLKNRQP